MAGRPKCKLEPREATIAGPSEEKENSPQARHGRGADW